MGFLDYFIEKTEDPQSSTIPQGNSSNPPSINLKSSAPPPIPSITQTTQPVMSSSQEDLDKFSSHFDDLFEKANLPGPDYFEFSKMCQAMAALPDETKFVAVFGGLKVQGLTKKILVESANHYIGIIDEDSKKFSAAIDGKILSEVSQKRKIAETKRNEISQREEMIKKLQEEIANETMAISNLEKEASEQEFKANQKSIVYKTACEMRKTLINSDVQKINNLIK